MRFQGALPDTSPLQDIIWHFIHCFLSTVARLIVEFKDIYSAALIKSVRGLEADLYSVDDPGLLSRVCACAPTEANECCLALSVSWRLTGKN